jgi:hypothetical protein
LFGAIYQRHILVFSYENADCVWYTFQVVFPSKVYISGRAYKGPGAVLGINATDMLLREHLIHRIKRLCAEELDFYNESTKEVMSVLWLCVEDTHVNCVGNCNSGSVVEDRVARRQQYLCVG